MIQTLIAIQAKLLPPKKNKKTENTDNNKRWSAFRKKKIINIKQPKILQQQSAEVLFTEEHQP